MLQLIKDIKHKKFFGFIFIFMVLFLSYLFTIIEPVKIYKSSNINNNLTKNKIKIISEYMPVSKKYIYFEYIGNAKDSGVTVYLEDINKQKVVLKDLLHTPKRWRAEKFYIPDFMQTKVRLIATVKDDHFKNVIDIRNLYQAPLIELFSKTTYFETIKWITLFSLIVSILYGSFLKEHTKLESFIICSMILGLISFIIFYIYLYNVNMGEFFSKVFFFFVFLRFIKIDPKNYYDTLYMFFLIFSMLLLVLFIAYSGFKYPVNAQDVSTNKWLHLPIDNWIPKFFADSILAGQIPNWLLAPNWLTSDRPPLQTGFFLIFSIFHITQTLYLVVSIGVQVMVFVFIVLMIQEIIQDKLYTIITISIVFLSGFSFVNTLFVWPKFFSALYQAIAFYCVYLVWTQQSQHKKVYQLYGASSALALLAHGGAIFFLLPLSFLLLIKSLKKKIELGYGILTALIIYMPWLYYQKIIDPNKARLLKQHLAGFIGVGEDISFKDALFQYYHSLSFERWLEIRFEHLKLIFNSLYFHIGEILNYSDHIWKSNIFVHLDFSYLFFSSIFMFMILFVKASSDHEKTYMRLLLLSFLSYIFFWSLILSSRTLIHHGAYFGLLAGLLLTTIIVYRLHKYLFILLAVLNLVVFFKVYVYESLVNSYFIANVVFIMAIIIFYSSLYLMIQDTKKQVYSG